MDIFDGENNVIYVDCSAGIAGDMFLAALVEMTDGFDHLRSELAKISLRGYSLDLFRDKRGGISGLRFDVVSEEGHVHRHLSDIKEMLLESNLSDEVKKMTIKAFSLLAEAEGKVHGEPADHIHFHEVGAVDSIIDIAGAMIMLEYLGWPEAVFSPLNVGSGTVRCAHGTLPVPAPATLELLKGLQVFSSGDPMERVTPTGAVLVKTLGGRISPSMPAGEIRSAGIGLGTREGTPPNILRVTMLEKKEPLLHDRGVELSANIDDMFPEDLSYLMERLFDGGALDVWFENIQMKKNRPGVKVCVLAHETSSENLEQIMLRESSSLGLRKICVERSMLDRRSDVVGTSLGHVRVKCGLIGGKTVKEMPEFEDIKKIASERGMTLADVRALIIRERNRDTADEMPSLSKEGCTEAQQHEHEHGHGHEHHHPHRHPHPHQSEKSGDD